MHVYANCRRSNLSIFNNSIKLSVPTNKQSAVKSPYYEQLIMCRRVYSQDHSAIQVLGLNQNIFTKKINIQGPYRGVRIATTFILLKMRNLCTIL